MDQKYKDRSFDVVTIAGYRYTVTMREVMGWFQSRWFWSFLLISNILIILFLPHNQLYGLSMGERLIFWPFNIVGYLIVYIACINFGAIWCSKKPGRSYYTPIGMTIATVVCTIGSSFLIGYMHNTPTELGVFKWMEIIFNLLWASVFEAVHYAFILPRLRRRRVRKQHHWERFD